MPSATPLYTSLGESEGLAPVTRGEDLDTVFAMESFFCSIVSPNFSRCYGSGRLPPALQVTGHPPPRLLAVPLGCVGSRFFSSHIPPSTNIPLDPRYDLFFLVNPKIWVAFWVRRCTAGEEPERKGKKNVTFHIPIGGHHVHGDRKGG
jgi:hypothetical protein